MNDVEKRIERAATLANARWVIAICKQEVEAVIGTETLLALDDGSVWERAFLRIVQELDKEAPNPEDE